LRWRTGRAN